MNHKMINDILPDDDIRIQNCDLTKNGKDAYGNPTSNTLYDTLSCEKYINDNDKKCLQCNNRKIQQCEGDDSVITLCGDCNKKIGGE
jgi:hypothetical protein